MDLSLLNRFFHISLDGESDPILSLPATSLLDPTRMEEVLLISKSQFKATSMELPTSFVGLSFFGLCAGLQLVLAAENRLLDLTLENLTFQLQVHDDHVHGCFKIEQLRWKDAPEVNRDAWLLEELSAYYSGSIVPVIEMAALVAGLKPDLMWNQYGARMVFALDFVQEHEKRPQVVEQFRTDYELLAHSLSPDTFSRRKNPFKHTPKYIDNPKKPGQQMLMRSSCCMYDKRENGEKCYNCPQLLPSERETRKTAILAAISN